MILLLPVSEHLQHVLFCRSGRALELTGLNGLPGHRDVGLELILSYACGGDLAEAAEQGRAALTVIEGPRDA